MSCNRTQHTKQFKLDAVNYRKEHPDLIQAECAKISVSVLVPLLVGKPSSEIMMVTSLLEDLATTNLTKQKKSLVSNENFVMLSMHSMC